MTDSRSDRHTQLERAANQIFLAVKGAEADGFKVIIKRGWALNLHDEQTGETTALPIVGELD